MAGPDSTEGFLPAQRKGCLLHTAQSGTRSENTREEIYRKFNGKSWLEAASALPLRTEGWSPENVPSCWYRVTLMSSKQKVAKDGCDWLLTELWLLQLARLLLAKDIICIATGHTMVNEHLLPLWQVDWLLCPPLNRSAFVLQVNVFAPAVMKSGDELRYTELKAIVICTGACFSFYKMACHVHVYKQITV